MRFQRVVATIIVAIMAVMGFGTGVAAAAAPGTVLRTIKLDLVRPTGVAWDGHQLWVADLQTATLEAIDPATGKVTRRLDAPGYAPMGLTWDGTRLWVL
ncbi:MAG: hypothetical protein GXP48_03010, partial [Acidobacteria bacterium]|nr:hypothetical protein [Acidobacteriota bacterium]